MAEWLNKEKKRKLSTYYLRFAPVVVEEDGAGGEIEKIFMFRYQQNCSQIFQQNSNKLA